MEANIPHEESGRITDDLDDARERLARISGRVTTIIRSLTPEAAALLELDPETFTLAEMVHAVNEHAKSHLPANTS